MKLSARLTHPGDRPVDKGALTLRAVVPYCLAILAVAPGIVHFALVGQRFQESWPFGVVTLIAAWLQLLWALAVVVQPSRILWWRVGAILNAGIIVVDIATRTVGGGAGFGVAAAIVFAALVVVGCAWLLLDKRDLAIGRDGVVAAYGAVGVATAAILSVSLVVGAPPPAKAAGALAPAAARHGLQANVPLPKGVSFAGVRQVSRVPDMQYHRNISVDTWGWTVHGSGPTAVQKYYAAHLPKRGWTYVRWESAMGGYGNAKHLTACHAGQVLLISTSASKLEALDTTTGKATATVDPPRGSTALLIQIDRSPSVAQVACPSKR